MICSDITEFAPLYISGELDSQRAAEFDAHLKGCPACMAELKAQARLDAQLREAVLSEDVDVSRVNQRVRELIAGQSAPEALPVSRPSSRRKWLAAALGSAAALIILAVGYILVPASVAGVYADAATDHREEVVDRLPRPWVTDPGQIAALAEKQGVPGALPFALASTYHLERARACWLDRRFFLHLVYSDGAGEISLYLRPREGRLVPAGIRGFAVDGSSRVSSAGAESISSFETSRLIAVVVTDEPADAALRFTRAVSAAI